MKKYFATLAALAAIASMTSCGGGNNSNSNGTAVVEEVKTTLTPSSTKVKGDLSEYYEVVDKEHSLKNQEYGSGKLITITLKRTDAKLPANYKEFDPVGYYGSSVKGNYGFGIKVTNENGDQLFSARADEGGMSGVYSSDDLKDLWDLEAGEEGIVRWSSYDLGEAKGNLKFTISSYVEATEPAEEEPASASYGNVVDDIYSAAEEYTKNAYKAAEEYTKNAYKAAEEYASEAYNAAADAAAAALSGYSW